MATEGMKCQYGSKTFFITERGRPLVPVESCIHIKKRKEKKKATYHFIKQKPIIVWESINCRKPEVTRRKTTGLLGREEKAPPGSHLVKAATTAHRTSLALVFTHSTSGSRSRSCRTLLVAKSYCSSSRGAKAFSSTSEAWAR